MSFVIVCIGMIVVLGIVAAVANLFDKEDDTIKKGHDCSTCTEADQTKATARFTNSWSIARKRRSSPLSSRHS